MLFNSIQFTIFFPIVVLLYFLIPYRFRWLLLLIASCYFYMSWKAEYIILLATPSLIDYLVARKMGGLETRSERRPYLIISLICNLGLLFAFKYFNFFNHSFAALARNLSIPYQFTDLEVILPVGISFYTFQTMSYTIDVYRGVIKPEKDLGIFAVFVSFFPQLVAGPIERAKTLLPQFYRHNDFEYNRVVQGLRLMLWGMFKKVVIADTISKVVNETYNNPTYYSGPALTLATVLFAFQIYCDFSGYSDIAIGAARVLGYDLMKNFNRPYSATSIADFWQRWHISLSSWFRDYVYIPLGGNRVTTTRRLLNLFVVFLVSGLWHGANWTFVIWGALHGSFYVLELITKEARSRLRAAVGLDRLPAISTALSVITTFILVCFAWIFFRANSASDAFYIVSHALLGWESIVTTTDIYTTLGIKQFQFEIIFGIIAIIFLLVFENFDATEGAFFQNTGWLRWPIYYALFTLIVIFGFGSSQFIYFQF